MDLNFASNSKPANIRKTRKTAATTPKNTSAAGKASIFNNAQNTKITGSSLHVNFNAANGLDVLHKRVAPNAILNAGGRADEVRCHPGTRKEVIGRIEKWRDAKDDQTPPIFWLSGPAGAGKSAIMQTIAERCKAQGVPQANFFFFRADGTRSNASPLVATLLHQVIRVYPPLRDPIAAVFSDDPLILDSILEEQLTQLLVTPLRVIPQLAPSFRPLLLLIDGLDECDSENKHHQRQILRAFDKVLAAHPSPFRLLVASRDESQITAAFNEISSPLLPLYLNNEYSPARDIRIFVNDQFKQVRKTHPLAYMLDATWPSVKDVEGIVEKSSGQFIYAATVMRFISDSSASPALSLQRVQGAARIATKSPFAQLDAIYTYILSQVDDQEALKDILHSNLLLTDMHNWGPPPFLPFVQILAPKYAEVRVRSCLADLTSVAQYSDRTLLLLFHHASFSDYLRDTSRSGDYFFDIPAFCFKILPVVFKFTGITSRVDEVVRYGVLRLKRLPPDLLKAISTLDPSTLICAFDQLYDTKMFKHIYSLCTCAEDVVSYKQILRTWINTLDDSRISRFPMDFKLVPGARRYLKKRRMEKWVARYLKFGTGMK